MSPQSLANVAWATACAGCLRVELLRPLQARALELADKFNERELKQFYQAELTLRLEAPDSCALLDSRLTQELAGYDRFESNVGMLAAMVSSCGRCNAAVYLVWQGYTLWFQP